MVANDPHAVAKVVQNRLRGSPLGSRLRVLAEEVTQQTSDGVWWYVPVSIHRDPEHMAEYYETLSDVEEQLETQEHLAVLLVPRIMPFQKWQDIA